MDDFLDYKHLETLYENNDIIVFRAQSIVDKNNVIIKSIKSKRPRSEAIAAFRHEFQINQSLQLPGLVHCQKLIETPSSHFLIFDDVGGLPLKEFLNHKALKLDIFFPIALEIISCIADLHENKIIHKDIKPDNILIDPDTLKVKLLDLSLASQLFIENQEVVSINKLEGSLPYISPEQTGRMNRPIDYRSDYYSLGITFYEMLTGTLPFLSTDPLEYVHFHLAIEAKPAAKTYSLVPEMLSKLVAKLMSKSADDRYQSAAGLTADLTRCYQEWSTTHKISEFNLGTAEVLDHLTLSTKMYGRQSETEALLNSFERVKNGELECLMITGYSGIGKTTLVNELQKPIVSGHGNYINGKFDQLLRTTPYTAFTAAFSKLFHNWLIEPEAQLIARKETILTSLGQSGQVIVEYFPELEMIIGPQPEIESLPPEQAQNRFLKFFQKFISCIASRQEPLVIFIDDLQWIDQASLRLLEIILTTQDAQSILFIGAYRDNEVDELHPLMKAIENLKKKGVGINNIVLNSLDIANTNKFLSDSLRISSEMVAPLGQVIFKKTAGNPFFTKEFLKECYNQKILHFSYKEKTWQWDLEKIADMPGSSNVVELILEKIHKLSNQNQNLLQFGSCLGMSFDSSTLSEILEVDELEIAENLSPALKEGLLQKTDGGLRYKFIHDRIQQAAYQMLPEDKKQQLHLKIGRLFFSQITHLNNSEQLFETLDHLKKCTDLIDSTEEQKKLADICLIAGKKASASGAYQAAYDYFSLGLEWTKDFDWQIDRELLWALNLESGEALYLMRESAKALELCDYLLSKAKTNLDKGKAYRLKMVINLSINKLEDNIKIFIEASAIFGLHLESDPSRLNYKFEYFILRMKYGKREKFAKRILGFKRINSEELILISDIFFMGGNSAAFTGKLTFIQLATIKYLSYYEKKGIPDHALFQVLEVICRYIFLNNQDLTEYRIFYNICTDLYNSQSYSSSHMAFFLFRLMRVGGYFLNIKDLIKNTELAIQDLIEVGSFNWLPLATNTHLDLSSFSDLSIHDMMKLSTSYLKMGNRFQIANIIGSSHFSVLSHQHLLGDEQVHLQDVINAIPPSPAPFGSMALFNHYFEEDYEKTRQLANLFIKENKWVAISVSLQQGYTVLILSLAQLYKDAPPLEKKKILKEIKKYLKILKNFSNHNPGNFLHLYLISLAELAFIQNNNILALDYYRQTISLAVENGFSRWAAIANERAGDLHLHINDPTAASSYFYEALYYYDQWGCALKVKSLQKKHASLLASKQSIGSLERIKSSSTTVMMTGELDLMSMIKANQAISSEIVLDKLLPRILRVVIESAGAEKAVFIGLRKNIWTIEAYAEIKGDVFEVNKLSKSIHDCQELPEGLITYVIRSGEPELIADMTNDEKYSKLPFVLEHQPKSVLCLPIKRDHKVIAALYLENNLATQAFTPDRLQLLQALSVQIAISLENATYLEHTQELFHATERFVPKKFLQLLGRDNIEEVQIGDSVKVEMSAIFADLRDFTTISESIEPEQLTYILNMYLKYMAPIIRNNNGFINRVLGDGILALFPMETQDAVQAAIEMQQAMPLFNQEIKAAGFQNILMGIGVNTGSAMLCALGEEERIEANVVSDMVNAASRIEGLNKMYGTQLLISDTTYNKLRDPSRFSIRKIDTIRVKGKTKAMGIYEVLPITSYEEQSGREEFMTLFEKASELYKMGDFSAALHEFEKCLQTNPEDTVSKLFKDRCNQFLKNTPENWEGIMTMLEK
ncbi:MAG: AAA family ATPase [Alphaproteobacteria bacterium]|nr:AAA family ATPase [Alphaproteobacteria bacterium]